MRVEPFCICSFSVKADKVEADSNRYMTLDVSGTKSKLRSVSLDLQKISFK